MFHRLRFKRIITIYNNHKPRMQMASNNHQITCYHSINFDLSYIFIMMIMITDDHRSERTRKWFWICTPKPKPMPRSWVQLQRCGASTLPAANGNWKLRTWRLMGSPPRTPCAALRVRSRSRKLCQSRAGHGNRKSVWRRAWTKV